MVPKPTKTNHTFYTRMHSRVTPKKWFFDFRNLHLMGGWLVLTDSIFEEKMKIDLKMVDREAGQFLVLAGQTS